MEREKGGLAVLVTELGSLWGLKRLPKAEASGWFRKQADRSRTQSQWDPLPRHTVGLRGGEALWANR